MLPWLTLRYNTPMEKQKIINNRLSAANKEVISMNNNIRVGSLFGIPFYVNPSWFLVLGLVTLSYGSQLVASFPQLGVIIPWILGFITALLLFASVLAHELGHSFVAQAQGIEVKSISLFLFGGLAMLDKESKTPWQAFSVAIAGPLVSIVLYVLLTVITTLLSLPAPLAAIISLLAALNLVLALFNLIPGLPLDGGNILKALVWKITGNPNQGVLWASRFGQAFGGLAIITGISGVFFNIGPGSFWTLLIGWFLWQNAGMSAQSATVQDKLSSLRAEDAVLDSSPVVSADLTLREFANDHVIGQDRWTQFLATDSEGQLLGTIAVEDLKKVLTSLWTETQVLSLVKPWTDSTTVKAEQSLLEVVKMLDKTGLNQLPVVRDNGTVVGILEKRSIVELLKEEKQG